MQGSQGSLFEMFSKSALCKHRPKDGPTDSLSLTQIYSESLPAGEHMRSHPATRQRATFEGRREGLLSGTGRWSEWFGFITSQKKVVIPPIKSLSHQVSLIGFLLRGDNNISTPTMEKRSKETGVGLICK